MSSYLIGKKIVLKSNSEIRYTGTLHAIDTNTNSISLVEVTSLGTEDRLPPGQFVPPLDTVYPYVVFRAADVTDIAVVEEPTEPAALPKDSAILAQGVPPPPHQQQQPQQQPSQPAPPAHQTSPPIAPPIAPSIATAHSTTLQHLQHESQPSRQPIGPSVIPFEQLASGSRWFAPRGRGNGPPRRGGRGRAPGAFSAAAEEEDLSREFDFAGMNARFADLRTGEKADGDSEAVEEKKEDEPEEEKKPAYNKKSSFFDSVSSNIQNPGRGRGRSQQYGNRNDGRQHQQQREPFQHHEQQGHASNYTSVVPLRFTQQGPQQGQYPPRQQNNHRFNRRDESALNDLTFGDGAGADAPPRRGRGRGNGRRRGSDVQQQRVFETQQ